MIKIICDSCNSEIDMQKQEFSCTIDVQEIVHNLISDTPVPAKQGKKTIINLCKDCYKKKVAPAIQSDAKKDT